MLNSPSSRRKGGTEVINLNLVPILDAMVVLIAFLLFTMSFLIIVTIETPMPMASSATNEKQLKEKPLQLTLSLRDNEAEVWSPFERIQKKIIPNVSVGQPDINAIHTSLLDVKKRFPLETKIVLVPSSGTTYDTLIAVMDASRLIDKTDPPMFQKNVVTQVDEPMKMLFGDVIFGNLLGGS